MTYHYNCWMNPGRAEKLFNVIQRRPDQVHRCAFNVVTFDMEFTLEELTLIKLVPKEEFDLPIY